MRPGKQRQRQIDRRRVQRIGGVLQLDAKGFVGVELACLSDQAQREVAVDAPIARNVGVGQRAPGDATSKADVIELACMGAQASFHIAQAQAASQLRERHRQQLVQVRELERRIAVGVTLYAATKRAQRQMIDQLGEHELACVHRRASRCQKARRLRLASSSRGHP
ncbi:hypothetical protein D3C83_17900 [compost metagenome]